MLSSSIFRLLLRQFYRLLHGLLTITYSFLFSASFASISLANQGDLFLDQQSVQSQTTTNKDLSANAENTVKISNAEDGFDWPPKQLTTDTEKFHELLKMNIIRRATSLGVSLKDLNLSFNLYLRKLAKKEFPLDYNFPEDIELITTHLANKANIIINAVNLADIAEPSINEFLHMGIYNPESKKLLHEQSEEYLKLQISGSGAELLAKNGLSVLIMQLHQYFETPIVIIKLEKNRTLSEQLQLTVGKKGSLTKKISQVFLSGPGQDTMNLLDEKNQDYTPSQRILDTELGDGDKTIGLQAFLKDFIFDSSTYQHSDTHFLLRRHKQLDFFRPTHQTSSCSNIIGETEKSSQ